MARGKSKDQKNKIEPKQLQDTLAMTAREYIQTREYQKQSRKRWEQWLESQRKHFEDMAKIINRVGVPQALKTLKDQFTRILNTPRIPREVFSSIKISAPPSRVQLIEIISDRTAKKVFTKLKNAERQQGMTLFLTEDGDLYREPKSKYCYPMREEKMRLAILRNLGHEFKKTRDIQEEVGSTSTNSIRKAVGGINRNAKLLLELKRALIQSKAYSGYKINSFYTMEEVAD